MYMRMVRHRRAPGVKHRRDTDPGAEMLGVGGDLQDRVCARPHQQIVDLAFVLIGDVGDRLWQRKDQMEIPHWQQFGPARRQPGFGRTGLTLGAMAIATRIVGNVLMSAVCATRDMSAERRRAAALNRPSRQIASQSPAGQRTSPSSDPDRHARYWHHARQHRDRGRYPQLPTMGRAWRPMKTRPCPSCAWSGSGRPADCPLPRSCRWQPAHTAPLS